MRPRSELIRVSGISLCRNRCAIGLAIDRAGRLEESDVGPRLIKTRAGITLLGIKGLNWTQLDGRNDDREFRGDLSGRCNGAGTGCSWTRKVIGQRVPKVWRAAIVAEGPHARSAQVVAVDQVIFET